MTDHPPSNLERSVVTAAQGALAEAKYVSILDVFADLNWLSRNVIASWRQGRIEYLEQQLSVSPEKLAKAIDHLRAFAERNGLVPAETDYLASTRGHPPLRFTVDGDPERERSYRTHWMSPELSEAKREQLKRRQNKAPDLVVVEPIKDWTCASCGDTGPFLFMENDAPLCLDCADLGHLVFLPAGNAALSRRAKKASSLAAVVVRFSRSRKRYERQGVLVQQAALELAEDQCLADAEIRERRRERDRERRENEDVDFQARFAERIVRLFPQCPPHRAEAIARHAGTRGSGRVGRSAAGRALDENAVTLAVVASIRHQDTDYDELLMSGVPRDDARARVDARIDRVLSSWR